MTSKEELTKQLKRIMPCTCLDSYKKIPRADPNCSWCGYGEDILEFVIKDRKLVCEPLVKYKEHCFEIMGNEGWDNMSRDEGINYVKSADQTLKNAGYTND